ncbi:peptidoglycan hydrolase-like protein with peptidoglycan-binding domain [Kribbella aluminosa]|uniref:Peptidoglycan hydrolase-like protein with peptidoglycan-binding domain n=1 Tax=Kribbella aluminosa TaxID=416017 RepID=A0ABS4UQ55_9ACTN|nr:peptidoglycan-binding protein [Kribbella aluminosa]MBP2353773.1 peptidoglycan hydrolase-like protein with peptidoglycan-binding domain [Kribbella aluminosa]
MTASPKSRRRVLVSVAGVAVVSLGIGVAAGSRISSPEDAAAKTAPPAASQITVPVAKKLLSSKVVGRGDASFDGAVNIRVETAGLTTPPIVTGKVPTVGSSITEGKALLEITGRPVIGLAGVLPMYRTLSPGSKGPDVLQLEQTLERLGYNPGTVDDQYTLSTSAAVEKLYANAGYDAPAPEDRLTQAVDQAKKQVDAAKKQLRQAQSQLKAAKDAKAKDTSVQQGAVDDAQQNLSDAQQARSDAEFKAGTPLPVSEVVYVKTLPRRVDDVKVERGGTVNGVVMSASGASLVVTLKVDAETAQRLKAGMAAALELSDGTSVASKVLRVTKNGTQYDVVVAPNALTGSQLALLRDANVRVTIPVKSTSGKVLAVPVAALSSGSDGASRVEVLRNGKVELVPVSVGLSADGFAQVTPKGDAQLSEGDQVVVGK